MIYCPTKYDKIYTDINKELLNIKGEMEPKDAQIALAKFLRYNLGLTTELISGFKLATYQEVILKAWFNRNYCLNVWGRGAGKTLVYNDLQLLLEKSKGLASLVELLPNVKFSEEKWQDIPELNLWNGSSWQKTNKIYIQPSKRLFKITTNNGYNLTGSINHIIKVLDINNCKIIWKKYSDLTTEDYVCISRNTPEFQNENENLNDSYLIGLLIGDGCLVSGKKFRITTADQEIVDWVQSHYSIDKIYPKKNTKAVDIVFSEQQSLDLLNKYKLIRTTSYYKTIPNYVLQNKNNLKEFLSGLFDTDGTADELGYVSLCSVSEKLILQTQVALSLFGINSKIRLKKTKSPFGKAWLLDIVGKNAEIFFNKIGFKLSRKQKRFELLNKNFNTNKDVVPGAKEFFQKHVKSKYRLPKELSDEWRNEIRRKANQKHLSYDTLETYLNFAKKAGFNIEDYKNLLEIQKENFFFDKIKSIEDLGRQNCIDFNVPDGESYWANGFINHNSTMAAVYCFLKCIFEPRTKILIAGPTFRTARNIFTELEKIVKNPNAQLLAQAFSSEPSHKNDLLSWQVNGGSIVAIPLNGEKIRGFRCNVLILDEFLLLSEDIIKTVLMPFLVAPQNISERLRIREIEDELIKSGDMLESERTVFGNTSQMIALSSASFTFENLYKTYKEWTSNIYDDVKRESTYFVSQISYQALPEEMVEKSVIEEASSGGLDNPNFLREYCAHFTDGSDGYFSAKKMQECTIPDGEEPHLKLIGDKEKKYIISIDPNISSSQTADYFAIAVIELDEENETGTLVHNYANAGGDLKDHINYFYYLYRAFNPVLIVCDSADGNFIPSCNESEKFIDNNINLKFLETWNSDLDGVEYEKMMKDLRKDYNLENKRICIKQYFTSEFIRRGNENLQACIDYKKIWFGSKIRPDGSIFERVQVSKIPNDLTGFNNVGELIDEQDELIYNVKKQCALIEVKTTARGTQSFELPSHLKRSKDPKRARKDNYTALMLGTWGQKIYFELSKINTEPEICTFDPIFI